MLPAEERPLSKAYWISRIMVTVPVRYGAYAEALPAVVERFGGQFLVAGGQQDAVEGNAKPRNVVIAFESYETTRSCWKSEEYAAVARLREGAADVDVVIVEGVPS